MEITTTNNPWRDKPNAIAEMEDDYQQWIGAARDMATPAQRLQEIVQTLTPSKFPTWQQVQSRQFQPNDRVSLGGLRVFEAIAAHPNTPPRLLRELLENTPTEAARGLCRNPVAPFLLLEAPAFAANLPQTGQLALLREADCPPIFVEQMANVSQLSDRSAKLRNHLDALNGGVEEAARLHVAFAGKLPHEGDAWQNEVRAYWKSVCADPNGSGLDQAAELAEIGLAPSWASVGQSALAKAQKSPQLLSYPFLDAWFRYACAGGSPEETAMLKQIGPDVKDETKLARALRQNGSPDDLITVARTERSGRGLVAQALLRHPNTDTRVLDAIAERNDARPLRELLAHPRTGPNALRKFMEHNNPTFRALARQHKNAPDDNYETARAAFVVRAYRSWETERGLGSDASLSPFASFVASLVYPSHSTPARLLDRAESLRWTERMEAVFIAFAVPDLLRADGAGRTCVDLLRHLSLDGNRLVRAAARACINSPKTFFHWDKGGSNE